MGSPERGTPEPTPEVEYNASEQCWGGVLLIPANGEGNALGRELRFVGSASGVFGLLSDLDRKFRAALKGEG
jgi:hypothetical protein